MDQSSISWESAAFRTALSELPTLADRVDLIWETWAKRKYPSLASSSTWPSNRLEVLFAVGTELPEPSFDPHVPCVTGTVTEIGRGRSSVVLDQAPTNYVWKKRHPDSPVDCLWKEYMGLLNVFEHFAALRAWGFNLPLIPKPRVYYNPDDDQGRYWKTVSTSEQFSEVISTLDTSPTDMLVMEQIPAVCRDLRRALWDCFGPDPPRPCDPRLPFPDVYPCIIQLCLGGSWSTKQEHGSTFSLKGCKLYPDQLYDISKAEMQRLAREVGEGLAVLHWVVRVDACGVKFYLGGWPTKSTHYWGHHRIVAGLPPRTTTLPRHLAARTVKRPIHVWATGFGRCSPITMDWQGIHKALEALPPANETFPHPPRPKFDGGAWLAFSKGYEAAASRIFPPGHLFEPLPRRFMMAWHDMYAGEWQDLVMHNINEDYLRSRGSERVPMFPGDRPGRPRLPGDMPTPPGSI